MVTVGRETFDGFNFCGEKMRPYKVKFVGINFRMSKMGGVGCGITDSSHRALPIVADCFYEFAIPSSVRGHHVYKDIQEATIGETFRVRKT